jgi:hypothetical protein
MGIHRIINGFNGGLLRDESLSNLRGPLHGARGPLSPLNTRLIRARVNDKARTPNLPAVAISRISSAIQCKRDDRKNFPRESENKTDQEIAQTQT